MDRKEPLQAMFECVKMIVISWTAIDTQLYMNWHTYTGKLSYLRLFLVVQTMLIDPEL